MNRYDRWKKQISVYRDRILKGLFLYALPLFLCLLILANPIGDAVRASDSAAFRILLAAFSAVVLNWVFYYFIHRKRPSLLVLGYGVFCLLLVAAIQYEALPGYYILSGTLAVICGCLILILMFLLSYWFAARRSRYAHVIAVGLWITIGLLAFSMIYHIARDIEARSVSRDTWINISVVFALILGAFGHQIHTSLQRSVSHRRATGMTTGKIVQIIGETHLDLDDDPVTDYYARIQYTVENIPYETRADIYELTVRRFGKKAFVGREITVHYDPLHPDNAFVNRIDRHLLDQPGSDSGQETGDSSLAETELY